MKAGRTRLVAGNWKMNGALGANQSLVGQILASLGNAASLTVVVCPPYPYLSQVGELLRGSPVRLGAQDLAEQAAGAYTGDVSGAMLQDLGCHYVIVGHSERRQLHAEADVTVAAKFLAARRAGLNPILCVGETLDERERGETGAVVCRQLDAVINAAGVAALGGAVLAYEPVWAIGTGRNASASQAQEVHALLRQSVAAQDPAIAASLPILYGGSVKPGNARELFGQPDVDGGLIGGASLVAADFAAICQAAAET